MAASPTSVVIARARRSSVRKLADAIASATEQPAVFSGRGPAYQALVAGVTVNSHTQRASNGEVTLWACAHGDNWSLKRPPWCDDGATIENVLKRLGATA